MILEMMGLPARYIPPGVADAVKRNAVNAMLPCTTPPLSLLISLTFLTRDSHIPTLGSFPQVIDLDMLDRVGASHGTEDLKEQLKAQEQRYVRELAAWDKKIASRMEELMAITQVWGGA